MNGSPGGVTFDAAGDLFATDFNNERIRKVDAPTGLISTIAATAAISIALTVAVTLNAPAAVPSAARTLAIPLRK